MLKLNANVRCAENPVVVSADEDCIKYNIPGGGTAFSFRYRSYRIPRLSDLALQRDVLRADGVLQLGIIVDLGDIPIEDVTIITPGMKYLTSFRPTVSSKNDLDVVDLELGKGIEADGFLYRKGFYAIVNKTYGLRTIAFKANLPEFAFDKRQDTMVAFRVVKVDTNGDVTVVWHELERRDAPSIKL